MVMEMVRLKMTVEALKPQVCRVRLFEREVVVFNRCDLPINTGYKLVTSAAGHAQQHRFSTEIMSDDLWLFVAIAAMRSSSL